MHTLSALTPLIFAVTAFAQQGESSPGPVGALTLPGPTPSLQLRTLDNDDGETPQVFQREYLITDLAHHARVQTAGVAPCVVVTFFDLQTHTGVLAHTDGPTSPSESFPRVLQEFTARNIPLRRLQATILGGEWPTAGSSRDWAQHNMEDIEHAIAVAGVAVVLRDYLRDEPLPPGGHAYGLDLSTGEVYAYNERVPFVRVAEGYERTQQRLWSAAGDFICSPFLYRSPESLPSVGVSEWQDGINHCEPYSRR